MPQQGTRVLLINLTPCKEGWPQTPAVPYNLFSSMLLSLPLGISRRAADTSRGLGIGYCGDGGAARDASWWGARCVRGAHLEDLGCGASAVGKRHVSELHLPVHVVWSQGAVVHHGWLAVDELKHLLGSSHSLHQAAVDRANGLEGKRQQ